MIKDSINVTGISFGDFLINPKNLQTRKKEFFKQVDEIINWNPVIYRIEKLYDKEIGRPGFSALVMFKALLLAQWYGLSDPELEDCLKDRISFKQFVGLQIEDDVPDETTLCRFRNKLSEKRLLEKLFKIINKQLEEKGIFVKEGTLIDASIARADGGNRTTRDEEAAWTKKNTKSYFGYKHHIGMDMRSHLVHRLETTPANVHDSQVWDELLHGEEKAIFADKAYVDNEYKHYLRKQGIFWGILDKKRPNSCLSKKQKKLNKIKSKLRAPVERFFAVIQTQYNYIKVRYRGVKKNRQHLFALGIAYNLQQATRLCS